MNKKSLFIILCIITLGLFIGTYFFSEQKVPAKTNTVTVETITYAIPNTIAAIPAYVAADKGFWEKHGLKINLQYFNSGREALDSLLANQSKVMSVSETPPMNAVLQGHKIYWVATVTEHKEAKFTYNTGKITNPKDIIGKKIATFPGTNSDYYMYLWLEHYGISPKSVNIFSMAPPAMVQAMIQGEIDGMFAWEPHNFNTYSQLGAKSANWPNELYEGRHSIIMNQAYVEKNPIVVEKLLLGFLDAENFIVDNPAEAKKIVERATKIDPKVLDSLWNEYLVRVELDNKLLTILHEEAVWATKQKNLDAPISDFKGSVYTKALRKLMPERVGDGFK